MNFVSKHLLSNPSANRTASKGGQTEIYGLPFKYLPATLSANEGKMIKTVTIKSFINSLFKSELSMSLSEDVRTTKTPKIPKAIEE